MQGLHIPTRTLSCPITTRTLSKKFLKVSRKFPIKFRALLPLAHFRKGNFSRSEEISKALLPLAQLRMRNLETFRAIHMDFHLVEYVDKILTQLIFQPTTIQLSKSILQID